MTTMNDSWLNAKLAEIGAGFEQLEKESRQLKDQREKMKCCGNCRHQVHNRCCNLFSNHFDCTIFADWDCSKWEARE